MGARGSGLVVGWMYRPLGVGLVGGLVGRPFELVDVASVAGELVDAFAAGAFAAVGCIAGASLDYRSDLLVLLKTIHLCATHIVKVKFIIKKYVSALPFIG